MNIKNDESILFILFIKYTDLFDCFGAVKYGTMTELFSVTIDPISNPL
jgi:hypothetical protein